MIPQRIHITGLGRSGTTLFRELHRCFKHTWVDKVDTFYAEPLPDTNRQFAVTKRPSELMDWSGWNGRPKSSLPSNTLVPCLIRHPAGVLDSVNTGTIEERLRPDAPSTRLTATPLGTEDGTSLERQLAFMMDSGYWEHPQVYLIRYEELVIDPDYVQEKYAKWAGLEIDIPFTRGHERFAGQDEEQQNGYRPIEASSIHKWKYRQHANDIRRILLRPTYQRYLETYYPDFR